MEKGVASFDAYSGTLEATFNRGTMKSWDRADCDHQLAALLELFERCKRHYGTTAHTVVLLSYTGREIGLIKRTVTSRFRFHCG